MAWHYAQQCHMLPLLRRLISQAKCMIAYSPSACSAVCNSTCPICCSPPSLLFLAFRFSFYLGLGGHLFFFHNANPVFHGCGLATRHRLRSPLLATPRPPPGCPVDSLLLCSRLVDSVSARLYLQNSHLTSSWLQLDELC